MPFIGQIKRDANYRKYIWIECIDCGEGKWTVLLHGQPQSPRCRRCAPKHRSPEYYKRGEDNPSWIRGWKINKDGYKEVLLQPDDFFYPMAKKGGYVLEHRLIMSNHLGRCLHRWEIVHHKNKRRDDNRIRNLQLVSDERHNQITLLEQRISYLEKRVTILEAENAGLRKELEQQIN